MSTTEGKSKLTLAKKLSATAKKVPVARQEETNPNLFSQINTNTKSNLRGSTKTKKDLKDTEEAKLSNNVKIKPKEELKVETKKPRRITRNKNFIKDETQNGPLEILSSSSKCVIKIEHDEELPSTSTKLETKETNQKSIKKSIKKKEVEVTDDKSVIKPETSDSIPLSINVIENDTNLKKKKSPKKKPPESPLKNEVQIDEDIIDKWQPENWQKLLENIRIMRSKEKAPVDTMGCHKCADENADEKTQRFHKLVALMLSSQTKDDTTYHAMLRLREHTLTPESICEMKLNVLENILHPVSFYKNKAKYLQQTSKILIEKYNSDIPDNIKELVSLPGVGPKMAHICMSTAWDITTGIGVDVHVHRISNRLRWVPKPTKEPEDTRKALEKWLPRELWNEVNYLLVGFGQTVCTPQRPKCLECLNCRICPAAPKTKDTPEKRENSEVMELCHKPSFKKKKMHV
ncbi:uncharacterized protein LOC133327406 [Musca vetustissima]|uniref:uncharacterized protein LOC133327406 n=1 Tax=Musca vetustissima TaxID=27455 RepID=UPI002AB74C90|nr:uncharacterized protein LOC133327406 [Musca vetustissima]